MAGLSLQCGDCGTLLKSVDEAQEHAELTKHTNFVESTEAVLHLVCSTCSKPCRSKTESDLHTKRTGHAEFVDKTAEAAKPISLEAPKIKDDVEMEEAGDGSSSSSVPEEMVVPEVNQQLLAELEEMGFPKERATRALHYSDSKRREKMATSVSFEMEPDAYRRLFPLQFHERHLLESIRPDGRPLGKARDTSLALGAVASAHGSALAKIGSTTMLAAVKMEVMTPTVEAPDEGCIAIEFHMPPICSPLVRPGRPAEIAPVISKQLSDIILSSGMIDLKELSLVSGKAAWMAYLDIYCLDADGALFDSALLSAVAAFSHLQIPVVSLSDEGRIVLIPEDNGGGKKQKEPVNKDKRKLTLKSVPFALTCILHKNYILVDSTSEEESIMETFLTVVLDSSFQLVSLNKLGGPGLAQISAIQDCIKLTKQRVRELQTILNEAIADMEVD